jgi:hypothetical protein
LEQPTQPLKSQRRRYNLYEPSLLLCSCLPILCVARICELSDFILERMGPNDAGTLNR